MNVKKALDSVSHQWIIRTLEMHRIHNSLINFIKSAMKTWRITLEVNTSNGKEKIGAIKVNRVILQGDSFCVRLFPLALNPIAWYLRSTEGYTLSHAPNQNITNLLFVDDLKSYHRSEQKATVVLSKLKMMFKDIGLEWGINKCAAVHIKRGRLKTSGNNTMPTYDDASIPLIGDQDHYNFLGRLQNTQHLDDKVTKEAAEENEKRMWVIWTTPLSIPRKVKATNTYALPTLQYYMLTTDWPAKTLRDLDRLTRKIINECHDGKHRHESTQLFYLPPEEGEKGLMEIEALYKQTKTRPCPQGELVPKGLLLLC